MLFEDDDDEDELLQELLSEDDDILKSSDEDDELLLELDEDELLLLEISDDELLLLELSEDELLQLESTDEGQLRSLSFERDNKLSEMLLLSQLLLSPSRLQALFPRSSMKASEGCLTSAGLISSGLASGALMLADAHTAKRSDHMVIKRFILLY